MEKWGASIKRCPGQGCLCNVHSPHFHALNCANIHSSIEPMQVGDRSSIPEALSVTMAYAVLHYLYRREVHEVPDLLSYLDDVKDLLDQYLQSIVTSTDDECKLKMKGLFERFKEIMDKIVRPFQANVGSQTDC